MRRLLPKIDGKTIWLYLGAVALVVIADPTRLSFTVGLILAGLGETIRVWAAGYLRKNEILVTGGPYGHVKNPLYIGTMFITAGSCIMANNVYFLAVAFFGFLLYYIPHKRRVEHHRLETLFGESFVVYDSQVDDYMPKLRPYGAREGEWRLKYLIENGEQGIMGMVAAGVLVIGLRFWI